MKILVTGALGHIGSSFIRQTPPHIIKHMDLLDNLSTQRYASLFHLPDNLSYHFWQADICEVELDTYLTGVDVVIHLAAKTDAEGSVNMRQKVEQINFEGTKRVAKACVKQQCKLIFLSTTSVYGHQAETVHEDCPIEDLHPQSPYAESKLKAEQMLQEKGQREGLQFIICRFGTIFGPSVGMRFHTAINKFCWQACLGQPLTVWRTAMHQKRPYLDLKDAVRALNFILVHDIFDGRIYNVLTTNVTVKDIIEIIQSTIPDLQVTYVDSPIMNQLSYNVSCQRFIDLGFDFSGDLKQGIEDTLQLFQALGGHTTVSKI
jgi:nucleoside-diphosphate-sugar epimerase